ncbi:MAG: MATE family efflux transporter, partial [Paramuribaculum sp.]|nr:MATE family efflux transporter [Paramuribaculum sp.]
MTSSLNKRIAALALPAIIVNITTPLLSIADVAIAGHLGDTICIAAIAVGSTAFNLLYWLLGFLRMGTSGLTAQAHGAGTYYGCRLIAKRGLAIAISAGLLICALGFPIGTIAMHLLDVPASAFDAATQYFFICVWGAPAVLGTFVLTGWFVGMQNTRIPMYVSLIIDIFNILLSILLAIMCDMGITGIATGTLAAQWLGFILLLLNYLKKIRSLKTASVTHSATTADKSAYGITRLFKVNADIFLRTLCLV